MSIVQLRQLDEYDRTDMPVKTLEKRQGTTSFIQTPNNQRLENSSHIRGILTVKTHEESIRRHGLNQSSTNLKRNIVNPKSTAVDTSSSKKDHRSCSNMTREKSVSTSLRYKSVTIREYAFIPGDNPSVSKGVPLTIDWDHQWEGTFDLDAYEHGRKPRHQIEMKIPAELRSELLRNNGHSWKDIQASIKAANIARRLRTKTIERLPSEKIDEKLEKMARGVKSIFRDKRHSKPSTGYDQKKSQANKTSVRDESSSHSDKKDDLDVSWSNSAKQYDLSPSSLDLEEQVSLSEDLSDCPSVDDPSDMSFSSLISGLKETNFNTVTHSDRSDPSNDTSSTEESLIMSDSNDTSNHNHFIPENRMKSSFRQAKNRGVDGNGDMKNTTIRKVVTFLEYGHEFNPDEGEKDDDVDVCCGGSFLGRAGKLLQMRQHPKMMSN